MRSYLSIETEGLVIGAEEVEMCDQLLCGEERAPVIDYRSPAFFGYETREKGFDGERH